MRIPVGWLLTLAVAASPALAHHTLRGVYETSRDTVLHGVVAEFRFVNPHPILVVDVRSDDGSLIAWELELDNRFELERIGLTRETFEPGDHVFVRGSVGRIRPNTLYLWRLDRPGDGFWYEQRGSRPYTGFTD